MFIGDYPNIHDGSLLYLVQLEGGSRMKVKQTYGGLYDLTKKGPVEYLYQTSQFYVNDIKVRLIIHFKGCKIVLKKGLSSHLLTFFSLFFQLLNALSLQSSDDLKSKLKIQTFSLSDGGSCIKDSKGCFITSSSQGQKTTRIYDKIGPDFQVFRYGSQIVSVVDLSSSLHLLHL